TVSPANKDSSCFANNLDSDLTTLRLEGNKLTLIGSLKLPDHPASIVAARPDVNCARSQDRTPCICQGCRTGLSGSQDEVTEDGFATTGKNDPRLPVA